MIPYEAFLLCVVNEMFIEVPLFQESSFVMKILCLRACKFK